MASASCKMVEQEDVIVEMVPTGLPAMMLEPMLSRMEMPSVAKKMSGSKYECEVSSRMKNTATTAIATKIGMSPTELATRMRAFSAVPPK